MGIRFMEQMQKKRRLRIIICLAAIATVCAVVIAVKVIPYVSDVAAFRREQASLPDISPFDAHWLEINTDYVGWLKIDGTIVNFPVVRGKDNEKYLNTTFFGEENKLGAIFMDYRCVEEEMPHIIIYGHQAIDTDGNVLLFGGLSEILNKQHPTKYPVIMFMENNNLSEFEIFSARMTDTNDPAYQLDFSNPGSFEHFLNRIGAPAGAEQIITLSTCIGADNDRRMLVQGVFKRTVRVNTEYSENGWRIVRQN